MYPSSTPPLDRGHCPRHFAGVEEGFTKWEEVLLIVNICDSTSVQFNGPEYYILGWGLVDSLQDWRISKVHLHEGCAWYMCVRCPSQGTHPGKPR